MHAVWRDSELAERLAHISHEGGRTADIGGCVRWEAEAAKCRKCGTTSDDLAGARWVGFGRSVEDPLLGAGQWLEELVCLLCEGVLVCVTCGVQPPHLTRAVDGG